MKYLRLITLIGILLLLSACQWPANQDALTQAQELNHHIKISSNILQKEKTKRLKPISNFETEAKAALLINAETGDILYEKNINETLPVASMSKLMTILLVLEAVNTGVLSWDDPVPIGEYPMIISNWLGIDSVSFRNDTKYTVRELVEATTIRSVNGASIALAEAIAGDEDNFVMLMNEKAKELGLNNSQFANSTGLSNRHVYHYYSDGEPIGDNNMMSAQDVASLAQYIIEQYPNFLDVTRTPSFNFHHETIYSTNWLLPGVIADDYDIEHLTFDKIDGLKTGYTGDAGYCFVGTAIIENVRVISVIAGSPDPEQRFYETKQMYDSIIDQFN